MASVTGQPQWRQRMHTLETTAHTGSDGVLRLEVPTGRPNQTMEVVVIAHVLGEEEQESRLLKQGIRPPTRWNDREGLPLQLGDPPVSETVVEDRR
jgi:hypothetical protein